MEDCPFCNATDQRGPVCLRCGKSLCEADIKKLNSQRDKLIKKYKVCYKTLKMVEKSIKNGHMNEIICLMTL
jgi:methionyl-tRNA synthetase